MKFAVGYQPPTFGTYFSDLVKEYAGSVYEMYFPWPGKASGRSPILMEKYLPGQDSNRILLQELRDVKDAGVKLDLLLNANCYGGRAISISFEHEILEIINELSNAGCKPETITTTSIFVARTIRQYFPTIELRASVNMRIGTIQAMQYVIDLFDSFYVQRDRQRNLNYVKMISEWCHAHKKKLCMLVNSGCLRFCPSQIFHDNLIAHCTEVEQQENVTDWNPHICWNLYQKRENWSEFLKSTWIRPEDIYRYDGIIDVFKLATRQHSHPRSVIGAYTSGEWHGDLLELMEPGFSPTFAPYYLDNTCIPLDFFEKTSKCENGCTDCGYCEQVLKFALKNYNEFS